MKYGNSKFLPDNEDILVRAKKSPEHNLQHVCVSVFCLMDGKVSLTFCIESSIQFPQKTHCALMRFRKR